MLTEEEVTTDKEFTTDNAEHYVEQYNEKSFWDKLKHEAARAGATVVYMALQLYYLMLSKNVPLRDKAMIVGALGYLILPTDLIPDMLPGIGYADDLTALTAIYNRVSANIDDEIRHQAQEKTRQLMGDVADETFDLPILKK